MSEIPVNLFICMYITIGDHIKEGDVIILEINNSILLITPKVKVHNKIVDESYFEKKKESHIFSIPKKCITGSNIYELAIRIYMDRIYNGVSKNK
jgi:predicted RNA methylase